MGVPDLPPHHLAVGVALDSSVSPRADPVCSHIFMAPADPQAFLFSQPLAPGFSVNSQGPTCFNTPCPSTPISHLLHNPSLASVPSPTFVLLAHPKGPSQFWEDDSSPYTLWHTHSVTTQAAERQAIIGHMPQCLCLYSAPSLPGPGGNKCTLVALSEICLLF